VASIQFVRHAQPDWPFADLRGLRGASRDLVGLTPTGVMQAESIATNAVLGGAELILTSPYTRALHTAAIISRCLELRILVEYDLREWVPDLTADCDSFAIIQALAVDFRLHAGEYPDGETRVWETLSSLRTRVHGVLERYAPMKKIIVVSHEMAIGSVTGVNEIAFAGILEWQI
jgi:broad specificity phosphatase PhoE